MFSLLCLYLFSKQTNKQTKKTFPSFLSVDTSNHWWLPLPDINRSVLAFCMMHSAQKLDKQGDNVLLCRFGTSLLSISGSNCYFLTCIQMSQQADQVVWYSHLFQNFPQFIVIHTVIQFVPDFLRPHGLQLATLLCLWYSPGWLPTGAGCHALLQGIFPTKGQNPSFLHLLLWQVHYLQHHLESHLLVADIYVNRYFSQFQGSCYIFQRGKEEFMR